MTNSIKLSAYNIAILGLILSVSGLAIKFMGGQMDTVVITIVVGAMGALLFGAFVQIQGHLNDFEGQLKELKSRLDIAEQE